MTKALNQHQAGGLSGVLQAAAGRLTGMPANLFFLLIFVYHVLVIFQGLDFNDEGFHVAFYQQIFNNPESVQYAFWSWLCGIVGGLFMKLFPLLGIWGIRLLGAIVSTATIIIAYNLLKRYLHNGYLKVSLIMLSLFINEDAKNLYYNNFSAFLYFAVAWFIFTGLRNRKLWMLFAGGFFVGLNIFSRLPNVLGVGMILALFYYGYLTRKRIKEIAMESALFLAGTLSACLLVFMVMKALGHLDYFIESVRMVTALSKGATKDDGLDGAYGMVNMLKTNLFDYLRGLKFVILAGIPVLLLGILNLAVRDRNNGIKKVVNTFGYAVSLGALALACAGWFNAFRLTGLFTGISLLSALVLIDRRAALDYKLLTFTGGLIFLIHPFGSASGTATVVVYSMWLSFPIAMDYLARLNWINLDLRMDSQAGRIELKTGLSRNTLRNIRLVFICVVSIACLYNVIRYPYLCDRHSRWEMRYSVNNRFMKWVFTSKGRAETLDDLLKASAQYVKPNDIVLAYDCMPMYHYMTETRSYVRNPCIWFYTTGLFRTELAYAESHQSRLPVIVRQLIKTTGDGSAWPETRPAENYLFYSRTRAKNNILNDFIIRHHYKEVWNNGNFSILIPQTE
jgi:hypothetical protein